MTRICFFCAVLAAAFSMLSTVARADTADTSNRFGLAQLSALARADTAPDLRAEVNEVAMLMHLENAEVTMVSDDLSRQYVPQYPNSHNFHIYEIQGEKITVTISWKGGKVKQRCSTHFPNSTDNTTASLKFIPASFDTSTILQKFLKAAHCSADVRQAAVGKLTDQALLANVAVVDTDSRVRKAAMEKLTGLMLLANVAVNDTDSDVSKAAVERIKTLIAAGADVNVKDEHGQTVLMLISIVGNVDCVKALIAAGADVKAQDSHGVTAFTNAVQGGNADCIKALVAAGADVNAKDSDDMTSLMLAAQDGNAACVKALIAAGADINAKNSDGMTALLLAAETGNEKYNKAVKGSDGVTRFFEVTPKGGNMDCVKALITAGADVNAKDSKGMTALLGAAMGGNADCLKALIDAGADVNAKDSDGQTALIWAISTSGGPNYAGLCGLRQDPYRRGRGRERKGFLWTQRAPVCNT